MPPSRVRGMNRRLFLPVIALIVVGGCGVAIKMGNSSAGDSKYAQTWPKAYSDTTCAEWNGEMTSGQKFAAAADMLSGARDKGDGGTGVAPDDLITEFQDGVTNACVIDTATLAETGASLYLTERERFRP
jgi:hypothetical protein